MLPVTVELLKRLDAHQFAVRAHELEALVADPGCDWLMMTLPAADQRSAEIKVPGLFRPRGCRHAREERSQRAGRKRFYRLTGIRMMLHAKSRVQEPQILGDLGDGGDGGFA